MSNSASGATVTRLFDPDKITHYALSEDAHLELKHLFQAMDAVATLADMPPGQCGPHIEPHQLQPLFATLAAHGKRIMDEAPTHFAAKPGRKPA